MMGHLLLPGEMISSLVQGLQAEVLCGPTLLGWLIEQAFPQVWVTETR